MLDFLKSLWQKVVPSEIPVTNQEADKPVVERTPLHYDPVKKDYVPETNSLEDFDALVIDTPKIPVTDAYPVDNHVDTSATVMETTVVHKHNNNHHFHDKNEKKHKLRPKWADDNKE